MTLKTRPLRVRLLSRLGDPLPGAKVQAQLTVYQTDGPDVPNLVWPLTEEPAAPGYYSGPSWPNTRGDGTSQYLITADAGDLRMQAALFTVPDGDEAVTVAMDLMVNPEPWPPVYEASAEVSAARIFSEAAGASASLAIGANGQAAELAQQLGDFSQAVRSAQDAASVAVPAADAASGSAGAAAQAAVASDQSAREAAASRDAANVGGKVYASAADGVAVGTGVAIGQFFNVRSPSTSAYMDEYQNLAGVATPTGKSYPATSFVQGVQDELRDHKKAAAPSPVGVQWALAVHSADGSKIAPLLRNDGALIGLNPDTGVVERALQENDRQAVTDGFAVYAAAVYNPTLGLAAPFMLASGELVSLNPRTGRWEKVATAPFSQHATYSQGAYTDAVTQNIISNADDVATHWLLLVSIGQSNALPHPGPATGAATPLYPTKAWMFSGGPLRTTTASNAALVPLAETDPAGETALSSWANHLIRDLQAARGVQPNVLAFVAAQGSQPYMNLKRGSPSYSWFLQGLDDAVAAIRAKGGTRITTVIDWMQGESDTDKVTGATATRYARQIQQHMRQVRADVVARTGEVEPPVFLLNQIGFTPGSDIWDQPVRRAAVLLDGIDHARLAGTHYPYPYYDTIHANSVGESRRGQALARATIAELFGTGWRGVKPVAWYWVSPVSFAIDFDCETQPLVLDTSGTFINTAGLANQGFQFDDGSGAAPLITDVSVAQRTVTVTLAATPAGKRPRWGYAMQRNAGNTTQDGPEVGARGTLRDSTAHQSLYDAVDQSNWAPAFVGELPPL